MEAIGESPGFGEGVAPLLGPLPPPQTPPASPSLSRAHPPISPLTPEVRSNPFDEYREVEPLISAPLVAGAYYCVINRRWYIEWLQWVGHPDTQSPKLRSLPDPVVLGVPEEAQLPVTTFEFEVSGTQAYDDHQVSSSPGMNAPSTAKRTRTHSWTKDRPGPIDNSELLEDNSTLLRKTINERCDYEIVPEEVWNKLTKWYGGGPAVKRRAIATPSNAVQVELHGLQLKVFKSSDDSEALCEVIESKCCTVRDFKARLCRELNMDPEKSRIWDYINKSPYANLEGRLDDSLDSCRIYGVNDILLEEQDADGNWPISDKKARADDHSCSSNTNHYSGYNSYSGSADVPSVGEPPQRGAVGLQNLGNTCFMNSSLQCLSNIPALREFFLSNEFMQSLNRNAYKTQGKLAEAYAGLLQLMWKEDTTRVAPRNFKYQVGQFAEQFSGYGQQDSMELIEYVLDGLKEDLNLVTGAKPYVEVKEADGRSDAEVAEEALSNHRLRSNSKVDDLFVGLFKSVVKCPEERCGRASVTFDPFLSAKLPLVSSAEQRMTSFTVTFVRDSCLPGAEPVVQVTVKVNKDQSVKDLIEAATKEIGGVNPQQCILIDMWNRKVHKYFEDSEAVDSIGAEDIIVLYEVAEPKAFQISTEQRWGAGASYRTCNTINEEGETATGSPRTAEEQRALEELSGAIIYHRQSPKSSSSYSCGYGGYSSREVHGLPMLLSTTKRVTGRDLYRQVEKKLLETVLTPGGAVPGWRLMKVDRQLSTDGTEVDPSSDELLSFMEPKEYFAIEWDPEATLPPRLAKDEETATATGDRRDRGDGETDLAQLLKMFVEEEKLGADDAWYCNKCKEHKEAFKQLQIHRTPPVLVLQLKRFQFTRWSRERLNTPVRFPLEGLNLAPYCTESSMRGENADPIKMTYDLAGMSKHIGSLGGGHYVAYCRNSQDGEWYNFDDGCVRRVPAEEVEDDKVGAYVLFYIRRDFRPTAFGPPAAQPP